MDTRRKLFPTKARTADYWTACHIPLPIAEFLISREISSVKPGPDRMLARAQRFRTFWERSPAEEAILKRHWKSVATAAISDNKLITLFGVMPDEALRNPFPAVYGNRRRGTLEMSVADEREHYAKHAQHVKAIRQFLFSSGCRDLRHLLGDAQATGGEALQAASDFQRANAGLHMALLHLEKLLDKTDPAAKYPYGQPDASDAGAQAFVALVAGLNRYLKKPKHASLAYLARVNCPQQSPTSDAVRKAWSKVADENGRK